MESVVGRIRGEKKTSRIGAVGEAQRLSRTIGCEIARKIPFQSIELRLADCQGYDVVRPKSGFRRHAQTRYKQRGPPGQERPQHVEKIGVAVKKIQAIAKAEGQRCRAREICGDTRELAMQLGDRQTDLSMPAAIDDIIRSTPSGTGVAGCWGPCCTQ